MAKSQQNNRPTNGRNVGSDKKKDEVIQLYERLTNILVTYVEHSNFHMYELPQTKYKCIYTHIEDSAGEPSGHDPCTFPFY